MKRFAAKLLFCFSPPGPLKRKFVCEERIVLLSARSASSALTKAKRRGDEESYEDVRSDKTLVKFEFVGVAELIELSCEMDPDEVWYELREHTASELRRMVPKASTLRALSTSVPKKPKAW